MRWFAPKFQTSVCLAVLGPFALMGCEAALQGQPRATMDDTRPSLNTMVIGSTLSQANVNAVLANQTEGNRNALVLARVAELDTLYNEYESQLLFEARQSGFLLSFTGALAGLAGATASAAASQNYSLLSGGINAAQSSYQKEVMAEQTMNALISQMRAERARVLGEIYDKLGSSVSRYPVQAAISDLERYRQSGTLATGLVAMNQASVQRAEIETENAAKKVDSFTKGRVTAVVRAAPGPDIDDDVVNEPSVNERINTLSADMRSGTISPDRVADFLNTLPIADSALRQQLQIVADGAKARTSQSTLRGEDITPVEISSISGILFSTTSADTIKQVEDALTN